LAQGEASSTVVAPAVVALAAPGAAAVVARFAVLPLAAPVDAALRALIFLAAMAVLTAPLPPARWAEARGRTALCGAIVALMTIGPVLAAADMWRVTGLLVAGSVFIAAAAEEIVFRERLPRAILAHQHGREPWALVSAQVAFGLAHLAVRMHLDATSDVREMLRLTAAGCLLMWFRIVAGLPSAVAVHAACNLAALKL